MGSDWIWELRVPAPAGPALRQLYALGAERNLLPQRPDGLINLSRTPMPTNARSRTSTRRSPQWRRAPSTASFWTNGDIDVFVSWEDGHLVWALDACFCYRRPVPEADTFRELRLPPPRLPEVAARTRRLPNGALLVTLLDDPAAVDPVRHEAIHSRWLRAAWPRPGSIL
ncbi:hypothetical protein ABZ783_20840 [Micromonospora sp. NPDC047738]|uniref:hypothetical protein n=1 Tax=Micromonospora sp. NPDC047738 TaxID=3155741 RepID=UPI0033E2A79A